MQIKKENIASYGMRQYEQTGTIAIDFANNLDKLSTIEGIDLSDLSKEGWYQIGFKFNKTLIDNSENLSLSIILSRQGKNEEVEFGYVDRTIKKEDFNNLVINVTCYISNQVHFEDDDINFKDLEKIED